MTAAQNGVHRIGTLPESVTGAVARAGWLEDWRVGAALIAIAVAVAVTWTTIAVHGRRAGRRPRRPVLRRFRRVGLAGAVALTALAGTGVAVNSYAGYAPDLSTLVRSAPSLLGIRAGGATTADAAGIGPGGRYPARLFSLTLRDPANRIPPGKTWVYLPAGYSDPVNAHRRYPVAYLLHGYPSSSYDWFGAGRVARSASLLQREGLMRPMILVSPDVSGGTLNDTECLDSTVGGPRIGTFLTRTVVGTVDRAYRTVRDRRYRVLGGVSSGGYCALNVGLRHQQQFGVILGLMPSGDPGINAVRFMLGGDARLGRLNSPSAYAGTLPLTDQQYVFLSASLDDPDATATAESLGRTLAGRGIYVGLRIDPAGLGHTWREARRQIPYALAFASDHVGVRPSRTPSAVPGHVTGSIPPLHRLSP